MDGKNPCECCHSKEYCDLGNNDCVLNEWGNNYCTNYKCMLNYEDCCLISIGGKCGANPKSEIEWEEVER